MRAFAKIIFTIGIALQFQLGNFAEAAENINKNQFGYWVVDGFEISLDIKCDISRSSFIPEKYCSNPAIIINKSYDKNLESYSPATLYFKLEAGDIVLGDKWMFDGNNDPQRKIPLSEVVMGRVRSEDLFKLLIAKDGLKIKFMTRTGQDSPIKSRIIILSDFKSYANEQIKLLNQQYDEKEKEEKRNLVFALILLASLFVAAIMLIKFLLRRARRKIGDVKEHLETRRVSRIAEDEAIREVVRKSVGSSNEESLETLR